MKKLKRFSVISFVLFCCIGCDQVSKEMARHTLRGEAAHSWVYNTIRLQYAENTGAFLSLGSRLPDTVRSWLLIVIPGIVLVGMLGVNIYAPRIRLKEQIAMALIIGGGLSNLFDRLVQDGHVTDFLNIGFGPLRTGIFNLADVFIMLGAGVLLLFKYTTTKREASFSIDNSDKA